MTRRPAISLSTGVNGVCRDVYDGLTRAGSVVLVGAEWRAVGIGGRDLGRHGTAVEATRAVLVHLKSRATS